MLIRALMFVLAFPLAGCMTISTVGGGGPNGVVYVTANDSLFASEASVYRCAPGDDGHYGCVELFDARVLERAPMVSPIDIESWGKTTGTPVPTAVSASGVDVPTEDEVPALDLFGTKEVRREWRSLQDLKVLASDGRSLGTEDTKPTFISGFIVRQLVKDGVIKVCV